MAWQQAIDNRRASAYFAKKHRLRQQQQQHQLQAQQHNNQQQEQVLGQVHWQEQGQEPGQTSQAIEASALLREATDGQQQQQHLQPQQLHNPQQHQGLGQVHCQEQGQASQAIEAPALLVAATEGLPGAEAGSLVKGAAPGSVSGAGEQELLQKAAGAELSAAGEQALPQQAAGAGLSAAGEQALPQQAAGAELSAAGEQELLQQAAGAGLSDAEMEEVEPGLSLLQEGTRWSQPYKPNFWDRHPALEGRLQAARKEYLALVKQVGFPWGMRAGQRHGLWIRRCGFG